MTRPLGPTLAAALAGLATMAAACAPTTPPGGTGISGEQLLVSLPPGDWVVGHSEARGDQMITEYVPRGQTVEDWSEMLTVQIFRGDPTPALAFLERMKAVADREQPCDVTDFHMMGSRKVNGYDGSRAQLYCDRNKRSGKGETAIIQALRGRDSLYVVQRAWRGQPFTAKAVSWTREQSLAWHTHLNTVSVCDSRDPARPACPTPKAR